MSDLSSDHNSAKCGLALNDPIDWFNFRLNQPKTEILVEIKKKKGLWDLCWFKPLRIDLLCFFAIGCNFVDISFMQH